jgi:hypothetical protein
MLQTLLANRIDLKIHRQSREVLAFALIVPPGGSKLKKSKDGAESGARIGGGRISGQLTTSQLAQMLSTQTGRLVLDKTGLAGLFDVALTWQLDTESRDDFRKESAAPPDSSAPSIFTQCKSSLASNSKRRRERRTSSSSTTRRSPAEERRLLPRGYRLFCRSLPPSRPSLARAVGLVASPLPFGLSPSHIESAPVQQSQTTELLVATEVDAFRINNAESHTTVTSMIPAGELALAKKTGAEKAVFDVVALIHDSFGTLISNVPTKLR